MQIKGRGIEIGVGSGRFAKPLGIKIGVDPSLSMARTAKKRGIIVSLGVAEKLPIASCSFDFVLITTTICFVFDIEKTFIESWRILNHRGSIILGFIDRKSFLGKLYMDKKEESPFYSIAKFYSTSEVLKKLKKNGFRKPDIKQTLFHQPSELKGVDEIHDGYGEGAFVTIKMRKEDRYL
ncbi:MAG: class I SAM-dependent methyltransferase [candidate division WOR-3 bacterium]|nr:class I SAM-dependent methyltransferase [candidate division WOR-3 bacterium]